MKNVFESIRSALTSKESRKEKAAKIAEDVRGLGPYRWVGIYDVGPEFVSVVAWSGLGAPAYPTFPVTQGITGAAIQQRSTVLVPDVRQDARYLTALASTLSEIIVPILGGDGTVVGTIDVESERANAFSERDRKRLERCAREATPLWGADSGRE
jgi:L-methionine (R)-S-oxide reductase